MRENQTISSAVNQRILKCQNLTTRWVLGEISTDEYKRLWDEYHIPMAEKMKEES